MKPAARPLLVVTSDASLRQLVGRVAPASLWRTTHAATGLDALRLLAERPFDAAAIDADLPDMAGAELAHLGTALRRALVTVVVGGTNEPPARAHVPKPASPERLVHALSAVREHCEQVDRDLLAACQNCPLLRERSVACCNPSHGGLPSPGRRGLRKERSSEPAPAWTEALSRREQEVLRELVAGARSKEIAGMFGLSTHTVRNHVRAILRKLGLRSQIELVRLGLQEERRRRSGDPNHSARRPTNARGASTSKGFSRNGRRA